MVLLTLCAKEHEEEVGVDKADVCDLAFIENDSNSVESVNIAGRDGSRRDDH